MIHMLCRFNLKPSATLQTFEENYIRFFEYMRSRGLAETTGAIGKRVYDTPMDTDSVNAAEYYVVMTFRDRKQLDRSYAHISHDNIDQKHLAAHVNIQQAIDSPIFTCWQTGVQDA
ncbi:hypothetical protein HGD85_01205 [Rhodobacteraceae bacterium R_SAG10]|jgi:hypothetical protein|nr:hypothetical protein [Rhodobacteraceae bacterium R_SAG10]